MWKMFDDTTIECDECGGFLGPPPKFTIPPPPRPPFMGDYGHTKCNEEEMAIKAQQSWDRDMCEAMPILDASLYSSQSLQTSAIIAVFTLLLILVILISSLFVWKNKRKVQNFLPCKTPTRGPHVNGGLPLGGAHALTYEDPDVHLGHHRPLVMRHHHNVEMLHGKSIHYPSGYPMTRSPPFLVSSSPGPDPYRSNDNVYEELGPGRDSDGESDPPLHSDDDFAEDELSLPGERFFNKTNDGTAPTPAILTPPATTSTIYHERIPQEIQANAPSASNVNGIERNSVLSVSSTSTQEASTATAASLCSTSHQNAAAQQTRNMFGCSSSQTATPRSTSAGLLSGMLRHTTGRSKFHTTNGRARCKNNERLNNANANDDLNTSSSTTDANEIGPLQQLYDNQSNLMSLAYMPQQQQQHQHHNQSQRPTMMHQQQAPIGIASSRAAYHHHSLHQFHNSNNNNNISSNNNSNARPPTLQYFNTLENEVDRRNRINAQLNNAPAVATIFRERINYPGSGRYQHPQPYYASNCSNGLLANSMRARTASRSMDRRRRMTATANALEPAYGYAEPVYHENYHYEAYPTPAAIAERLGHHSPLGTYSNAYSTTDYVGVGVGGSFRQQVPHGGAATPQSQLSCPTHLYNRGGDSSFGSDSGYSHHTPASSIGRHDYDCVVPAPTLAQHHHHQPNNNSKESTTSKISAALSFSWHRRKPPTTPQNSTTSNQQHLTKSQHTVNAAAALGLMSSQNQTKEATSPNNNSTSSTTVTSTLENTSSASSTSTSACSTSSNQNNNATTPATMLQQPQTQSPTQA